MRSETFLAPTSLRAERTSAPRPSWTRAVARRTASAFPSSELLAGAFSGSGAGSVDSDLVGVFFVAGAASSGSSAGVSASGSSGSESTAAAASVAAASFASRSAF